MTTALLNVERRIRRPAPSREGRGSWLIWRRWVVTSAPIIGADFCAIAASLLCVDLWGASQHRSALPLDHSILALLLVLSYALFGLYRTALYSSVLELRDLTAATTLFFVVYAAAAFRADAGAYASGTYALGMFVMTWLLCLATVPCGRWLARRVCSGRNWWGQPVLICGVGESGVGIYDALRRNPMMGLRPIGLVGRRELAVDEARDLEIVAWDDAHDVVAERRVTMMIVALADFPDVSAKQVIEECDKCVPHRLIVPEVNGFSTLWSTVTECAGFSGLRSEDQLRHPMPRLVKHVMDYAVASLVFIAILPLFALLALLVKLSSPGPIFYPRKCVGLRGRPFSAWKFRTMVADSDQALARYFKTNPAAQIEYEQNTKLKHDPRITTVGRFLRKTSLDELPQLWNVLCGEMSLVGPRPIVEAEIPKYGNSYRLRSTVMPGITGLWQVSGRSDTTYGERVTLDRYYIQNWSPWLDLSILFSTIRVVFSRRGAI